MTEFKTTIDRWRDEAAEREVDLLEISIGDVVFDQRTVLKCRYGCPAWGRRWTCGGDAWGPDTLIPLLKRYETVLVFSGTDLEAVTSRALATERQATVAGFPFALAVAVTMCSTCGECAYPAGACRKSDELRPESAMAGVHTMETLRRLGVSTERPDGWLRTSFVFLD